MTHFAMHLTTADRRATWLRRQLFSAVLLARALVWYVVGTRLLTRGRPPVPILDPGLVADDSFLSESVIAAVFVYGGTALLIARPRLAARP